MMTTYRLTSTPLIHTPGVVAWAINGYAFKRDRPQLMQVMRSYPDLPDEAIDALLSKQVPYEIEDGDTVVFTYPQEDAA